jgi:ADP-ribosylglycohydrolase
VLHTLDAVMWCLFNTDNYKDAVLKAVNLGGDTDTIAALTGGIAGLYYGMESIPTEWLDALANKPLINSILNIKPKPHANI